ncbi:MAG TPA: FAD-dependent monooxygenase [Gammaproteobacteria bacterium]|jgi:NADPH-dependent dioxygenase|nr:FAD-dependent monooxygenase [Gammaproteobacteria bacterium]
MKTSKVPVLVVGAGAAGTMLTLELARRGVRVRTVDRLAKPVDTSRAITVHARTMEIFERIDKRLIERYLDRGIHNKGYVLHFVDAQGARSEVRPGIDFTRLDSRYPYILVSRQSETEQYLREYTGAHYGVSPDWNTACVDVKAEPDGVTATLESGGVQEQVRCDYLVACDGPGSRVRQAIGLAQQQSDYAGAHLHNLDAYLNDFPDDDEYMHYCAGTDHFIMIVKLPGGFYRLLLSDRGEAAGPGVTPEQAFMRLVDRHFDGVTLDKVVWHAKWQSHVRLAQAYRQGRVFLAGDSAHVHSTTGGQGMNCCLQDAYNLGWKLAYVVKGLARPSLLDSYETERRPIAEQVIWAASSLHEIFKGHGKDVEERARKIRDPAFLEAVVGGCSGISYTYRDPAQSTGEAGSEGPLPGDRAPDVDLGGGRTLFALTRHPRYTLFALPAAEKGAGKLELELKPLVHRFKAIMEFHALPPSADLVRRYGASARDRLLLLRPDGYVAFRCLATDAQRLEAHLTERFVL